HAVATTASVAWPGLGVHPTMMRASSSRGSTMLQPTAATAAYRIKPPTCPGWVSLPTVGSQPSARRGRRPARDGASETAMDAVLPYFAGHRRRHGLCPPLPAPFQSRRWRWRAVDADVPAWAMTNVIAGSDVDLPMTNLIVH